MENANPALVVASASNPSAASIFAEPASQGLGIANIPDPAWRDLNASPRIACASMAYSDSFQQARRRFEAKLLEQLAHFSSFFGSIDLRLFRVLRPEENVTVIPLRDVDVLTQLLFVTFAQLEDGKLYAFALSFVWSDAIRVEHFQNARP